MTLNNLSWVRLIDGVTVTIVMKSSQAVASNCPELHFTVHVVETLHILGVKFLDRRSRWKGEEDGNPGLEVTEYGVVIICGGGRGMEGNVHRPYPYTLATWPPKQSL